ncbi:uncharacterized protein LOC18440124 [Amborella trichopoda]|uniref:RING-type domain-containing protein n=1 Tax=Amborella trichopoda TaxID=13333 RepID=W1PWZ8_AMBTC|nr:uncharacterized protein LOC18440124 [Amborella trichopoda]XP_011625557.1 uncharacterized protein LOC18440124 [Amborella trichopoda]ERN11920.1 hypothetical protein AMTR_s00020p00238060 [Amborella trichopoda]|eukprot:XP_006850339.1 uncharacterized protein LOC18440124 [Amborella trichopoda]
MEEEQRRRLTLSDQLSVLQSLHLRDFLRAAAQEPNSTNHEIQNTSSSLMTQNRITLGSVLQFNKTTNESSETSKTLLDIIRDEEEESNPCRIVANNKSGWKTFKNRLGFRRIAFCGSTWGNNYSSQIPAHSQPIEDHQPLQTLLENSTETTERVSEGEENIERPSTGGENTQRISMDRENSERISGMNLAAALAAERQWRPPSPMPESARPLPELIPENVATPLRMSLMALLEEGEGGRCMVGQSMALEEEKEEEEVGLVVGSGCCVCMVRNKGAAFIPCGHTFCRVCSREVWVSRGSCPLCNGFIREVLDIF